MMELKKTNLHPVRFSRHKNLPVPSIELVIFKPKISHVYKYAFFFFFKICADNTKTLQELNSKVVIL